MAKRARPSEQATAPVTVAVRDVEPAAAADGFELTAGSGPDPSPAPAPAPSTAPAEKAGVLNIPITADGGPAWESMRESTKNRVMMMIQKGGVSLDNHESVESFKGLSPMLWQTLSTLTTWAATRRLKNGEDDVLAKRIADVCAYSKQELEALEGPTAAILAKYAPMQTKWTVEINFAMAVVSVHTQKVMIIQSMLSEYIKQREERARTTTPNASVRPGPVPVPTFDAPKEE